jgi:hypothetical protein
LPFIEKILGSFEGGEIRFLWPSSSLLQGRKTVSSLTSSNLQEKRMAVSLPTTSSHLEERETVSFFSLYSSGADLRGLLTATLGFL